MKKMLKNIKDWSSTQISVSKGLLVAIALIACANLVLGIMGILLL